MPFYFAEIFIKKISFNGYYINKNCLHSKTRALKLEGSGLEVSLDLIVTEEVYKRVSISFQNKIIGATMVNSNKNKNRKICSDYNSETFIGEIKSRFQ